MSDTNVPSPPASTVPVDPRLAEIEAEREARPLGIPISEPSPGRSSASGRTRLPAAAPDPRLAAIEEERNQRTYGAPQPTLNRQIAQGRFGDSITYLGTPRIDVEIQVSAEVQGYIEGNPGLTPYVRPIGASEGLLDFSEPDSDWRSRFDIKLFEIVPENMRYQEVVDEMWMLPFISMVARADPSTGVFINGVHFDNMDIYAAHQAYKDDSADIFSSVAGDVEVDLQNENPNGTVDQYQIAVATDQILASMLDSTTIEIQVRPGLTDETSKIAKFRGEDKSRTVQDENLSIDIVDGEPVRTGGPMPYEATIDEDGGVVIADMAPVLDSKQLIDLARSSEADWNRIIELNQEQFDDGRFAAKTEIGLGQYGQQVGGSDPRGNRPRQYSPSAAAMAIYDLSTLELGNLQDRLVRSGYLTPGEQGFIDRGNPSDSRTMYAWKSALADALKNNQGVDKQIMSRVRNTPLMPQIDTYAQDWVKTTLGRNITFGEKQMLRRYVNDPNRAATTNESLDLESQVTNYLKSKTENERRSSEAVGTADRAHGFAKAYQRRQDEREGNN
jgi:hypothetical protein